MSDTSTGRALPTSSFTSRMRFAVICARDVSEQYAAANRTYLSFSAALSASANPASVSGALHHP